MCHRELYYGTFMILNNTIVISRDARELVDVVVIFFPSLILERE